MSASFWGRICWNKLVCDLCVHVFRSIAVGLGESHSQFDADVLTPSLTAVPGDEITRLRRRR
jgi:hypothetical protein